MVVLEVGIDAQGMVIGSQQAFSALGQLSLGVGQLTTNLKTAQGGIAVLGTALLAAQPYLVAVTAIMSGLNMAMNLFGRETETAARSVDKITAALRDAKGELAAAQAFGAESFAQSSMQKSLNALYQVGVSQYQSGQYFPTSLGQLTDRLGMSHAEMMDQASMLSDAGLPFENRSMRLGQQLLSEQQFVFIMKQRAAQFGGFTRGSIGPSAIESDTAPGYAGFGPFLPGTTGDAMATAGSVRWGAQQRMERDAQLAKQMREEMVELNQQAQQLGQYLGDAAFDFVAGLRDGREVLSSMAMDFGRILMRQAMTQAAQWAFGATG